MHHNRQGLKTCDVYRSTIFQLSFCLETFLHSYRSLENTGKQFALIDCDVRLFILFSKSKNKDNWLCFLKPWNLSIEVLSDNNSSGFHLVQMPSHLTTTAAGLPAGRLPAASRVSTLNNYCLSCSVWTEEQGLDVRSHRCFGFFGEECEHSLRRRLEVKASHTVATSTALSGRRDIMSTLCLIWKYMFSSIFDL